MSGMMMAPLDMEQLKQQMGQMNIDQQMMGHQRSRHNQPANVSICPVNVSLQRL